MEAPLTEYSAPEFGFVPDQIQSPAALSWQTKNDTSDELCISTGSVFGCLRPASQPAGQKDQNEPEKIDGTER
jgi:hypothetical protein